MPPIDHANLLPATLPTITELAPTDQLFAVDATGEPVIIVASAARPYLVGDTGPAGPAGSNGAAGAQGPPGAQGDPGTPGQAGAQGPQGIQGIQGPAGAGMTVARNTGNQTNTSNTTPTDITGLAIALTTGRRYTIRALVPFQTAATTTGIGFTWTGPAMTDCAWNVTIPQGAVGVDQQYTAHATALATVLVSAAVVAASTTYLAVIEGVFSPSANGTLQLRFRSEVNASQVTARDGAAMYAVDCG